MKLDFFSPQYLRLLLNKHLVNVFHKFLYGAVMEFIERNCYASDNELPQASNGEKNGIENPLHPMQCAKNGFNIHKMISFKDFLLNLAHKIFY